jgi:hypothetical protein
VLYAKATSKRDILLDPAPSEPIAPPPSTSPLIDGQQSDEDRYTAELTSYRSWDQRNASFLLMLQDRINGGTAAGIFERNSIVSSAYAELLLSHASSNHYSHHIALAELPHLKMDGTSPADIMDYIKRVEEKVTMIRGCELAIDDSFLAVLLTMEVGRKLPHLKRDFMDKNDLSFARLLALLRSQASTAAYDSNNSNTTKRPPGAVANSLVATPPIVSSPIPTKPPRAPKILLLQLLQLQFLGVEGLLVWESWEHEAVCCELEMK